MLALNKDPPASAFRVPGLYACATIRGSEEIVFFKKLLSFTYFHLGNCICILFATDAAVAGKEKGRVGGGRAAGLEQEPWVSTGLCAGGRASVRALFCDGSSVALRGLKCLFWFAFQLCSDMVVSWGEPSAHHTAGVCRLQPGLCCGCIVKFTTSSHSSGVRVLYHV